ncbi:hypothetical protein [Rhizobium herbae]
MTGTLAVTGMLAVAEMIEPVTSGEEARPDFTNICGFDFGSGTFGSCAETANVEKRIADAPSIAIMWRNICPRIQNPTLPRNCLSFGDAIVTERLPVSIQSHKYRRVVAGGRLCPEMHKTAVDTGAIDGNRQRMAR